MLQKDLILDHYREQAAKWGADPRSTMEDDIVRQRELEKIQQSLELVIPTFEMPASELRVCDLGCGNGFTLKELTRRFPSSFAGVDISADMLTIARARNLERVQWLEADITQPGELPDRGFHIIFTERCLINILDEDEQYAAIDNIATLLPRGGYFIMLECFRDGLDASNKARSELGLDPISPPFHNLWFDKGRFLSHIDRRFRIRRTSEFCRSDQQYLGENFLSSYYFMSRVFYPLVTRAEVARNTEFVKFFSHMPPIGNYCPTQCYILQRI